MTTDEELLALADSIERPSFVRRARTMHDFRYDEQQDAFWDITTGLLLKANAVNGAIPKDAWPTAPNAKNVQKPFRPALAINDVNSGLTVEGSTWWPGKAQFIHGEVMTDRGPIPVEGACAYNAYHPPTHPTPVPGVDDGLWLEHFERIYPNKDEREHFLDYAAHALQKPHEKVQHCIAMAGRQGIGKDSLLVPIRMGVGVHNTAEIGPDDIMDKHNEYVKSVLLMVNEVKSQKDDYYARDFYATLKPLTASPPEMLPMSVKYQNRIFVRNIVRVILTMNNLLDLQIEEDDRRFFVMHSHHPAGKEKGAFPEGYFEHFHQYLQNGGSAAVIDKLLSRDLSGFMPGNPPPETESKRLILENSSDVKRSVIDDVLERFLMEFDAEVIFLTDLLTLIEENAFFDDAKKAANALKSKSLNYRMMDRGWEAVTNPNGQRWTRGKYRSRKAFLRSSVPQGDRIRMVEDALSSRPLDFSSARMPRPESPESPESPE